MPTGFSRDMYYKKELGTINVIILWTEWYDVKYEQRRQDYPKGM